MLLLLFHSSPPPQLPLSATHAGGNSPNPKELVLPRGQIYTDSPATGLTCTESSPWGLLSENHAILRTTTGRGLPSAWPDGFTFLCSFPGRLELCECPTVFLSATGFVLRDETAAYTHRCKCHGVWSPGLLILLISAAICLARGKEDSQSSSSMYVVPRLEWPRRDDACVFFVNFR